MEHEKQVICIVCPMGCRMTVSENASGEDGVSVDGNTCKRGREYAVKELKGPTRMLPTTVRIANGVLNRLPVRTESVIPKGMIFECMDAIRLVEVRAPVSMGDIVIRDILGTGVNVIATRSMAAKG